MISVVLVTFNRLHLLRQCVENVLLRTSSETGEIVIWNNRSTDGTCDYLDSLKDSRFKVIHSAENVATNAYAMAFPKTTGAYMIELDDDIIDAPQDWDRTLLEAFKKMPRMGYLAAEVKDDGKSVAAEIRYRKDAHRYTERTINGVNVTEGPVGGWCTMTSREIYDEVGGFKVNKKFNFWHEDGDYVNAVRLAGYTFGLLTDLKVFHASGPAYSYDPEVAAAKARYYGWYERWLARRKAMRRMIDRIPLVNSVYARLRPKHWG
jgi:GT2 family glycosyltransferase